MSQIPSQSRPNYECPQEDRRTGGRDDAEGGGHALNPSPSAREEGEAMHVVPTTSGKPGPIETDDLSGLVLDGLDQLRRGVHEDFRADAQQARGVVIDLRARNLRLESATTLLGFDAAEEGCKLEALPPPLGNPGPHLDPLVGHPLCAHPAWDRELGRRLEALYPLGRKKAVRPHRDVGLPSSVEADAVPVPLRGVQAVGEDHPLSYPRLDGVVGNLQMYPVERRRQQLA